MRLKQANLRRLTISAEGKKERKAKDGGPGKEILTMTLYFFKKKLSETSIAKMLISVHCKWWI